MISQALPVHAKEVPRARALAINGIRAVFGEDYPDPVRVVSVGPTVDELLADPNNEKWKNYSIELCGGTHISSTTQVSCFTVLSEEPLARGVRRITAVTGAHARKAHEDADALHQRVEAARKKSSNELREEVTKLIADIDRASIPASRRHHLRTLLEALQKDVFSAAKSTRNEQLEAAQQFAERAIETLTASPSGIYVGILEVGSFVVGMTNCVKAIAARHPDVAILLLSPEVVKGKGKVTVVAHVPDSLVQKGLLASEWASTVATFLGGKGGGKAHTAQGSGPDVDKIRQAAQEATAFAKSKLTH